MNLQVFDSKPGVVKQMSHYVGLLHQRMTQQLKEISFPFGAVGDPHSFALKNKPTWRKLFHENSRQHQHAFNTPLSKYN